MEGLYGLKLPKCNPSYPKLLIIGRITNNEALENDGGEQGLTNLLLHEHLGS